MVWVCVTGPTYSRPQVAAVHSWSPCVMYCESSLDTVARTEHAVHLFGAPTYRIIKILVTHPS